MSTKGHATAAVGLQQSSSTYKTQDVSLYVPQFLSSPPKVARSQKSYCAQQTRKNNPKHTILLEPTQPKLYISPVITLERRFSRVQNQHF